MCIEYLDAAFPLYMDIYKEMMGQIIKRVNQYYKEGYTELNELTYEDIAELLIYIDPRKYIYYNEKENRYKISKFSGPVDDIIRNIGPGFWLKRLERTHNKLNEILPEKLADCEEALLYWYKNKLYQRTIVLNVTSNVYTIDEAVMLIKREASRAKNYER
jgi:hypothetical protein